MRTSELKRTPFRKTMPSEPKPAAGPRQRRCAICREKFIPRSMTHKACKEECAIALAEAIRLKTERKADRERKQAAKSRKDWEREAQAAINLWVREVRDRDKPCVSCGRWHDGQWHAGHYLSRGARPNLALVASNIAKQCMPCNVHLSGNQVNFRLGLIAREGVEVIEALEADHTPRKYTIEQLREIRDHYRALVRNAKERHHA